MAVEDIYGSTDCSGTPLASQTNDAAGNSLTIDGTKAVDNHTVDKISIQLSNVGGIHAGTVIQLNGLLYPGDYFTFTKSLNTIELVEVNKMTDGDTDSAADADGYPTHLGTTAGDVSTKL